MNSVAFFEKLNRLVEFLEHIIRNGVIGKVIKSHDGKIIELDVITDLCASLLLWVSSDEAIGMSTSLNESLKSELATIAVKLNNKGKNLSSLTSGKLRVLSKALSAWIIFRFHSLNMKSSQIIVQLLSSVIRELDDLLAYRSCQCVSKVWELINQQTLVSTQLTSVQLHDMTASVVEALQDEAKLVISLRCKFEILLLKDYIQY